MADPKSEPKKENGRKKCFLMSDLSSIDREGEGYFQSSKDHSFQPTPADILTQT